MTSKLTLTIISAVMSAIAVQTSQQAAAQMEPKVGEGMEVCYGVVKAHKNDCASKANNHNCAGQAKTDGDPNEWVKVPDGLCLKLTGGSLTPKEPK